MKRVELQTLVFVHRSLRATRYSFASPASEITKSPLQMIEEHRCSMSQIGVVIAFTVQITAMIVEVVE